jgi:hypothetical protein
MVSETTRTSDSVILIFPHKNLYQWFFDSELFEEPEPLVT